jgi:predicted restriction endonuclease
MESARRFGVPHLVAPRLGQDTFRIAVEVAWGYVTVTPEARFEVSRALRDEFANGRTYYALHGAAVTLPSRADERPSPSSLSWHNETVFRG